MSDKSDKLYPLKFSPIIKEKIWGGRKLGDILNKNTDSDSAGESWEISTVEDNVSIVANGELKGKNLTQIIQQFKGNLLGQGLYDVFGDQFPLLIKFIDANKPLSVQLHPSDEIAQRDHDSYGKTEMWYIMQADKDATINVGFNHNTNQREYESMLNKGKLVELLNFESVRKGDSFFIAPGTIHAIGAGVLLAEIQQTSDITYRVYDWDRVDDQGNSRELHTDQALESMKYTVDTSHRLEYGTENNQSNVLKRCNYFTTNYIPVKGSLLKDVKNLDSFIIYILVSGEVTINSHNKTELLKAGETLLIPADAKQLTIENLANENSELLEVYVE